VESISWNCTDEVLNKGINTNFCGNLNINLVTTTTHGAYNLSHLISESPGPVLHRYQHRECNTYLTSSQHLFYLFKFPSPTTNYLQLHQRKNHNHLARKPLIAPSCHHLPTPNKPALQPPTTSPHTSTRSASPQPSPHFYLLTTSPISYSNPASYLLS